MLFSGIRAVILIVMLVVLVLGVTKSGLLGWLLPVGLLFMARTPKRAEKKASACLSRAPKGIERCISIQAALLLSVRVARTAFS